MKDKEFRITGQFGDDGGLYLYNQNALNIFGRKHKGKRVLFEIKVLADKPSEAIIAYYHKYIIPEFQRLLQEHHGEYLTARGAEEFITNLAPMLMDEVWDDKLKDYIRTPKAFEDLNMVEAVHCLNFLKQTASMDYDFYIEDDGYLIK